VADKPNEQGDYLGFNPRPQNQLFRILQLWRPKFLTSIVSANDRISWVKPADNSQIMVNLGPHLENLANQP
jgi:hypothetical protein